MSLSHLTAHSFRPGPCPLLKIQALMFIEAPSELILSDQSTDSEYTHLTQPNRMEKWMALLAIGLALAHQIGEWKAKKKPIAWNLYLDKRRPPYTFFRYGWDVLRAIISYLYRQKKAFLSCLKQLFQPPNSLVFSHSGGVL